MWSLTQPNTQHETDAGPHILLSYSSSVVFFFFFFNIVSSSFFFLKVLLPGTLRYQEDSVFLPTDLTPNAIMYFQRHAHAYFPTASLGDGYLHNTSEDKILLFLNNLQKLLACRSKP